MSDSIFLGSYVPVPIHEGFTQLAHARDIPLRQQVEEALLYYLRNPPPGITPPVVPPADCLQPRRKGRPRTAAPRETPDPEERVCTECGRRFVVEGKPGTRARNALTCGRKCQVRRKNRLAARAEKT